LKKIGTGRGSEIWEVRDKHNKPFALKTIPIHDLKSRRAGEAALHEHEVARELNHPYLRRTHRAIRQRGLLGTRRISIVMELVDGKSLDTHPVGSIPGICQVFRRVARGLGALHRAGWLHADLKPQNVIVTPKLEVKLIDFDQSCKNGTTKNRLQGTTDFLAPEQARHQRLTPRTDIYCFGAMLYWYLTRTPVPSESPEASSHLGRRGGTLTPPHESRDDVPTPLSRLIMDCLNPNPAKRPASAKDVYERFQMIEAHMQYQRNPKLAEND